MTKRDQYFFWIGTFLFLTIRLIWNDVPIDDRVRLSGAINILSGNGYLTAFLDKESLVINTKSLAPSWPALTSYLLAGLTLITRNYLVSFLLVEILAIALFLYSFFRLITLNNINQWARILFLFFCFSSAFPLKVISIDMCCLAIVMYVTYLLAKESVLDDKGVLFWLKISGILSLTCLFRFNFYLVALLPAVALALHSIIHRKKAYVKFAFISLIIPISVIFLQSLYVSAQSSDMVFLDKNHFSLDPSNL